MVIIKRMTKTHFDAAYYARYYENPDTTVVDVKMQRNEVRFVLAFCRHIGLEVKRFSDVGAGTGWWAREFARQCRVAESIETLDASRDACSLYGHRHVAVQKLGGPSSDLVVCRDVLRYVPDLEINRAIVRLARKCRGVLYVHVITSDDDVDEEASDMTGFFRTTAFYRRLFRTAGFTDCGMGLFVSSRFKQFDPFSIEAR